MADLACKDSVTSINAYDTNNLSDPRMCTERKWLG